MVLEGGVASKGIGGSFLSLQVGPTYASRVEVVNAWGVRHSGGMFAWIVHASQFILHIDAVLFSAVDRIGAWIYPILFLVVFCETGLVVTPFLPGDSLLFAAGALAGAGSRVGCTGSR
jgi:hypothetical protein